MKAGQHRLQLVSVRKPSRLELPMPAVALRKAPKPKFNKQTSVLTGTIARPVRRLPPPRVLVRLRVSANQAYHLKPLSLP